MTDQNEVEAEPTLDEEKPAEGTSETPTETGTEQGSSPTTMSTPEVDYSQYDEADPDDGFSGGAGLAKMLMTLAVLGLVLGGGVYLAYSKKMKSEQAIELMTESVERLSKDGTYPAVSIVRDSLSRALEVVPDHPIAVSKLALLEAHSYMHNGEAEAKSRAETQLAIAESGNFEKAERFAARALIDIANDQQDKAYNDIKAIFDRGAKSSDLFFAFGVAQVLKGELGAGTEQIKKGAESQTNNVWMATVAADAEYRHGRVIGAYKIMDQVLRGSSARLRLRYAAQKMYYGLMFGRNPGKLPYFEVNNRLSRSEKIFKKDMETAKFAHGQARSEEGLSEVPGIVWGLSPVGTAVVALTHGEAYYRAGDLENASKKAKEAEVNLKKVDPSYTVRAELAKVHLLKGRVALAGGDIATADKLLRSASSKTAGHHSYHAGVAVDAAIQHRQWDLADQMLLLYEKASYQKGGKKLTGKKLKEAKADDYDRFLRKMKIALGRGEDAKDNKAKQRYGAEILDEKEGLLEQALSSNTPGNARRVLNTLKGNTMIMMGKAKEAKSHYESWLGNEPKLMATPVVAEALGRLGIAMKSWGEAEAALGKAANLYKGKGYDVYTERRIYRNVAQLYRARGKRAEAKRYQALADGKAAK
ncbi:MAG: hypothetical protein VX405_04570 [Myxococcota bacterium]|nr:hypothetical protein [Myxococcota bacterium]